MTSLGNQRCYISAVKCYSYSTVVHPNIGPQLKAYIGIDSKRYVCFENYRRIQTRTLHNLKFLDSMFGFY